jgi:AcrR family transcriptional regulator
MAARGSGSKTRRSVLGVAAEIVAREGVTRLTLDAVAERAGLSKGGILHHFSTKDSLIAAMIEDLVRQFEDDLARHMRGESGPGSFARAFLRACLDSEGTLTRTLRISAGIVAALAFNTRLLAPLRRCYADWRRRLENDGIDPAVAELVRSAADGLWFAGVLDLSPPNTAMRKRLFCKLIELTRTEGPAPALVASEVAPH